MPLMSRELSDVTRCVCRVCSVIVSAVPTHWIKYSTRAAVPADISNNAMAPRPSTPLHYEKQKKRQKQERLWGEKETERERGRRKGRPQIHEHSAAHTPGLRCQEPSGQQGACVRHSWEKWMPRINQTQDTLSRAIRVYATSINSNTNMLQHFNSLDLLRHFGCY